MIHWQTWYVRWNPLAVQREEVVREREIGFLKGYHATRPQILRGVAQSANRIVEVRQNQPANHGIEGMIELQIQMVDVALDEAYRRDCLLPGRLYCFDQHGRRFLQRHDFPSPAHSLGDEHGDVAQAGAEFQNLHPRSNSGIQEEVFGERPQADRLLAEPILFGPRIAQGVVAECCRFPGHAEVSITVFSHAREESKHRP